MPIPGIPENRDLTYIGYSTYRDQNNLFGIKRKDRRQHIYILGKSGTGKSVLMFNMIIQNIMNGEGVCVVDPHGELVEGVLQAIPPERVKDVVYFNPADTEYHIGFNVLELVDSKYKHLVASGLMGIFTKIWANAWSARMEYILNNAILALLDTEGSTLLGIPRLLVDKDYRQKIISNLKDPVIKSFWVHEYEAWQDKFRNEAIAPIQNKVGQFLSTSVIRNIVGQSKSTINIFDMMNEGKIFLVNVSKGRIGEDNSKLLGGMIITKIQLAAMERVRIPEEERKDFYLYVDEFQNFVTDSFASILSEARKYRLNLTVAHQYTAQLVTKESSAMRDSIFGNVGTMIVFRVGADDADFLEKEFMPEFVPEDIVNLPNYKIYLKLMINGITSRPFSAKTLAPLVKGGHLDIEEEVIKSSRRLYCRTKEDIEREINDWSGMSLGDNGSGAPGANSEKFSAKCSICEKETFVPFKPEPGRPVYCKDCIAKIKAGELKPVKVSDMQIKQDESRFFKPLADLGIEFPSVESRDVQKENIPQRNFNQNKQNLNNRSGIIPAFKKAFNNKGPNSNANSQAANNFPQRREANLNNNNTNNNTNNKPEPKPKKVFGENFALREILNKTLNENKVLDKKEDLKQEVVEVKPPLPEAISLDALKAKPNDTKTLKDRSASTEDMDKLKNFLSNVSVPPPVKATIPTPVESEKKEIDPVVPLQMQIEKAKIPPTPIPIPVFKKEVEEKFEEKKDEVINSPIEKVQEVKDVQKEEFIEVKKEEPKSEIPFGNNKKEIKEVPEDVLNKILSSAEE